ncbi:MAG: AMP-binding protein [Planctomycetaceae bacterium]|nr:AMP-binding protein [Planctomycetaceae bacterium]
MINTLLRWWVKSLLWLRYRVRLHGFDEVAARGRGKILFLPNHNALMDPVIMAAALHKTFMPRFLADRDQVDRFLVRWLAARMHVLGIPDISKYGVEATPQVEAALDLLVASLKRGRNALLYPAGQLCRTAMEDVRGNSAVEYVLSRVPDARVVLIRQRGLWGSGFSWAAGRVPDVAGTLKRGARALLASGIFFAPRRRVDLVAVECDDFPRDQGRAAINAYIETFYNTDPQRNTYVPYSIWERGGTRIVPEPQAYADTGRLDAVPAAMRQIVTEHLIELSGLSHLDDSQHLARDLGLDSLVRTELLVWLEQQFGHPQGDTDSLLTVADVMLAAYGEGISASQRTIRRPSRRWFRRGAPVQLASGQTIPQVFLAQARRGPSRVCMADQTSGMRTYREAIMGILALQRHIRSLPGENVGVMLPASVGAGVAYLATAFAGKTPVLLNWTIGRRNLEHAAKAVGLSAVLTSRILVQRLAGQGVDLGGMAPLCVYLEDLRGKITRGQKIAALLKARLSWRSLDKATVSPTAAILFTSGSEALPKAVPLTHANILINLRDVLDMVDLHQGDRMVGILPPFHSFGLTAALCAPLLAGMPVVYHPNPNEAGILASIIEAYRTTILMGTPTFLGGIVRAARSGQLDSLRMAVTGAEKCPPRVYEAISRTCPQTMILEGYGVTECSPIISLNDPRGPVAGTIGKVMQTLEYAIVDIDTGRAVARGEKGMLLVRGPSVFGGYLDYEGPSPFVEHEGKSWYRTGDLVSENAGGVLTFHGRLRRFVKFGGEMVSLPAVEAALEPLTGPDHEGGPKLAVIAHEAHERPELVLIAAIDIDREKANAQIRRSGLSPLHNIHRVMRVEEIPVLGTGKTDYQALKRMLTEV